jgi:hypothetical protein
LHFATLLLFCCVSAASNSPSAADVRPATVATHSDDSAPSNTSATMLPDAPIAKPESSSADPILPASGPLLNTPVKPAARGTYETARQRKIWYGLIVVGHSAAAFDAYTTRRAISGGYGTESDPMMRPFAHSNAMYAATQVTPAIMDFVGHRMMTSEHPWMRKIWWVPQAAGASVSLGAGIHNYRIVP